MTELGHDQRPDGWSAGAEGYDDFFAPFTGPYAEEALRITGVGPEHRVLDVAAGSGALSRRAAALGATVLAVDFAPGMVDLLRRHFEADGAGDATAQVMDGQALDLEDAQFDIAFSIFGLIFFPDIGRGLDELVRVVRPDGTVAIAIWRLEGFRLSQLVGESLAQAIPGLEGPAGPPPWARLGDEAGLASSLGEAGLADVAVHVVSRHWALDDPIEFFHRMPEWSPPVQPLFAGLPADRIAVAAEAFGRLIAEQSDADGLVVDALIGTGRTVAQTSS